MAPNFEMIGYLSLVLFGIAAMCGLYAKSFVRFAVIYMVVGFVVTLQLNERHARCGEWMPVDKDMLWRIPALSVAWPAGAALLLAGGDGCIGHPYYGKTKERRV